MYHVLRSIKHSFGKYLRLFFHTYLSFYGVKIGKNTMISLGAKIDTRRGSIIIGDNCTITWGSVILSHDAAASKLGYASSEGVTIIEDDVFIGVNSVVLPRVRIGAGSIIGSGSVVTKDIAPYSLAVGNPARVIKMINRPGL